MTRSQLTLFLLTITIMDAIFVGVLVGAATKSPWQGLAVGLGSAFALWCIVIAIAQAVARIATWAALHQRYPAVAGVEFERGVRIISLGLGSAWLRLNNCIEACADESHLHMRIGLPGTGDGRPISIPWEAVTRVEPAAMGQARLDVEGIRLWVPRVIVAREMALREAMERDEPGGASATPGLGEEAIG